jgi:ligand-binding sensor domain-containing protein/two-component sensor histidine kinase
MWFATQEGLSRFDGREYVNLNSYSAIAGRRLLGSDFYDIKSDVTGNYLWALSPYGGLNKIDLATCKVVARYTIQNDIKQDTGLWYNTFCENDRYLFIGTQQGIVCRFNKTTGKTDHSFSLINKANKIPDGELRKIMIDGQNRLWYFISRAGVLVTDSTLTQRITFITAKAIDSREFLFQDGAIIGDTILIATATGLRLISITHLLPVPPVDKSFYAILANCELHAISVYGNWTAVIGNNRFYRLNFSTRQIENIQFSGSYDDKVWMNYTNAIHLDKKHIWIGSPYGVGWIRDVNSPFAAYFSSLDGSNVKINHAVTICKNSDSTVLVCADNGLYHVNHLTGTIRKFSIADFYYSVFPVTGNYFISSPTSGNLQLLDHRFVPLQPESIFPELRHIRKEVIWCAARLGDSVVFMASQNKEGLFIWNLRTHTIDTINSKKHPLALRNDNINRLFIDSQNLLWIICENAISIFDYSKRQIRHLDINDPLTGIPLNIHMDICETRNNFWIATYGSGIIKLNKQWQVQEIYGTSHGLRNLGVYKIFNLNDSILLVSSNNGLAAFNCNTKRARNFSIDDGLQSNSFEEASGEQAGKFLFFGGINGITRVEMEKFGHAPGIDNLTFSAISFTPGDQDEKLDIHIGKLVIPANTAQVRINFSAINFSAPEKVRFRYIITGEHPDWNETDHNFIQFFSLSPGTYHLQVKAANEDGVWSDPIELTLIFLPKWYQTWWFKLSILLAVMAIAYGFYRMRINQLKREETIRRKLASDLHDDLGSTLNSVKVYASLAMTDRNDTSYLVKIKESTQEAIAGIRDIIWVLDDKRDTIEHIIGRISQFAQPLCEANGIAFHTSISDSLYDHKLGKEEKRNLYMIMKESINNSIKYAASKHIEVIITATGGRLSVRISDDGAGFDSNSISYGNGINNIVTRAREVGYKASVVSAPGKGTFVHLEKS